MLRKRWMEILITGVTLAAIAVAVLFSYGLLKGEDRRAEAEKLTQEADLLVRLMDRELEGLAKIARDYGKWDDTLMYYRQGDAVFEQETFTQDVFDNLNIGHMLFIEPNGRVRKGFTNRLLPGTVSPMDEAEVIRFNEKYSGTIAAHRDDEEGIRGIVRVNGQVYLLALVPISDTTGMDKEGALALTRPVDEGFIASVNGLLQGRAALSELVKGEERLLEGISHDLHTSYGAYVLKNRASELTVNLLDICRDPCGGIRIAGVNALEGAGVIKLRVILGVAFVAVLSVTLLHMWLNRVFILKPIRILDEFLSDFSDSRSFKDLSEFLDRMLFSEETSVIGRVHKHLRRISQKALQIQRDRVGTRLALDSSAAGTWEYNLRSNHLQGDAQAAVMLGVDSADFPMGLEDLLERTHPEDREELNGLFGNCRVDIGREFQMECRLREAEGVYRWRLLKGDGLDWDKEGNGILFSGILLDIETRKRMEEELLYLSYHDKLTGLYNRRYFEDQLGVYDTKGHMPVAIFVADINGLKLANDAFGHERGDALLRQAAICLQEIAGGEAVISRWGGDEYALLLPHTDELKARSLLRRIKDRCMQKSIDGLGLHLAVGYSVKTGGSLSLQHVVRAAEEHMYRDKLLESRSAHIDFLEKFKAQLHEKGIETNVHCRRTAELGLALGTQLGLGEGLLEEIQHLSDLHDIGKIAMPEALFQKTGALTDLEWSLIHNHPEIGFRIVAVMQDYAHLAQAILSHHEWYDGNGYPRGLKGREIPLSSRILALAEAVTVMERGAVYKKAMSREAIIEELGRCSGTQFDPELVDRMIAIIEAEFPKTASKDV